MNRRHRAPLSLFLIAGLSAGCASTPHEPGAGPVDRERFEAVQAELDAARQEIAGIRLDLARARQSGERLARQVERLRADVVDAEEALVTLESGLRGLHTRADAVSALADARILVGRADRQAPWRAQSVEQAREKLAEAQRHIDEEYFGSAVFFTVRGRRIAEEVLDQVRALREDPDTRYVHVDRANVREQPSTDAEVTAVLPQGSPVRTRAREADWVQIVTPGNEGGWIHGSLLADTP